ncbi:OmpA family protein [candidate division KSB1 bacterium]|nr:OmpA family protein [candidate division KSB1 bacterium]
MCLQRLVLYLIVLLLLLSNSLLATKYTAAFLNSGAGARALGLGGSFTALGLDATTIYWNPSALGRLTQPELVLMHAAQFNSFLKFDTGHFVWPNTVSGSFGIGYVRLATGDIMFTENLSYYDWGMDNLPGTGDPGEGNGLHDRGERVVFEPGRLKIVNDAEEALFLSYARQITPQLALGGSVKILRQTVGQYSSSGWGFDFGAIYDLTPRLSLALILQDAFGTTVKWNTGHADVRSINVRPGVAYRMEFPFLRSQLALASDLDIRFDHIQKNCDFHLGAASFDLHYGAEYWLYQMLALRIGSEQKSLTAGAGIRLGFFAIDYAFAGFDLGNSHRISVTLHKPDFFKKPAKRIEPFKPVEAPAPPEITAKPKFTTPDSLKKNEETKPVPPSVPVFPSVKRDSLLVAKRIDQLAGTIEFETGKAEIQATYFSQLAEIAAEIKKYPQLKIRIIGHTDNRRIRTAEFPSNQALSLARANAVKLQLMKEGIEANHIQTEGLGESRPMASNETQEGRRRNRRVEILLVE